MYIGSLKTLIVFALMFVGGLMIYNRIDNRNTELFHENRFNEQAIRDVRSRISSFDIDLSMIDNRNRATQREIDSIIRDIGERRARLATSDRPDLVAMGINMRITQIEALQRKIAEREQERESVVRAQQAAIGGLERELESLLRNQQRIQTAKDRLEIPIPLIAVITAMGFWYLFYFCPPFRYVAMMILAVFALGKVRKRT